MDYNTSSARLLSTLAKGTSSRSVADVIALHRARDHQLRLLAQNQELDDEERLEAKRQVDGELRAALKRAVLQIAGRQAQHQSASYWGDQRWKDIGRKDADDAVAGERVSWHGVEEELRHKVDESQGRSLQRVSLSHGRLPCHFGFAYSYVNRHQRSSKMLLKRFTTGWRGSPWVSSTTSSWREEVVSRSSRTDSSDGRSVWRSRWRPKREEVEQVPTGQHRCLDPEKERHLSQEGSQRPKAR